MYCLWIIEYIERDERNIMPILMDFFLLSEEVQ